MCAEKREVLEEQRYAIKFCIKLGKSASETKELLKEAFGESTMSQATIYRWYESFKSGRKSAELEGGPGAPCTALTEVTINTSAAIIREDPHLTVRQFATLLNISVGSAHTLLTDVLGLSRVCARWIPRLLSPEQKLNRVEVCRYWTEKVADDPEWLDNVITADETWIYLYDPALKQQSSEWVRKGGSRPLKARAAKSALKVMVITFFDMKGMIYTHTVPHGQTVNAKYYVEVLHQLMRIHIPQKRPEMKNGAWKLHHDNARPHVATIVTEFLSKKNVEVIPHPPYSPDLAPCDFYLYPTAKKDLKGRRFGTLQEVLGAVQAILKRMSKNGFQHVFEKWQERWAKCIRLNGEYLEGARVEND